MIVLMENLTRRSLSKFTNNSIHTGKQILIASKIKLYLFIMFFLLICRYAFDTFDANHDGTINFEEFLLAISVTSQGDLDDRLAFAFDL